MKFLRENSPPTIPSGLCCDVPLRYRIGTCELEYTGVYENGVRRLRCKSHSGGFSYVHPLTSVSTHRYTSFGPVTIRTTLHGDASIVQEDK